MVSLMNHLCRAHETPARFETQDSCKAGRNRTLDCFDRPFWGPDRTGDSDKRSRTSGARIRARATFKKAT
jgi:hypothetical protein